MSAALAFCATAIATVLAQRLLQRGTTRKKAHEIAWAFAMFLFALASAALALGLSTGWTSGVYRAFYLFGGVLNVPWLALGTVYLMMGHRRGRQMQWGLVFWTGLGMGVLFSAPLYATVSGTAIPDGKEVFGAFPRVLAGIGSGVGATIVFAGAAWSALQFARGRAPGGWRMAAGTGLIALGVLVTASKSLFETVTKGDTAFVLALTVGIAIIACGFALTSWVPAERRAPATRAVAASR